MLRLILFCVTKARHDIAPVLPVDQFLRRFPAASASATLRAHPALRFPGLPAARKNLQFFPAKDGIAQHSQSLAPTGYMHKETCLSNEGLTVNFFRAPRTRAAVPALFVLFLGLNSCGGGSSSPPHDPSYSLAATALTPATVTAGNTTTSTLTLTPTGGYSGTVTLS